MSYLLEGLLARLGVHHVEDGDLLERHGLRVELAHGLVHDREFALADGLEHVIVLQRPASREERSLRIRERFHMQLLPHAQLTRKGTLGARDM